MIKISTDSTADLGDLFLQRNVLSFPLIVMLGDECLNDGIEVTPEKIFDFVEKTGKLPKTAARGVEEYKEFFEKCTADGSSVIHFNISQCISSSNEHAAQAASEMKNVYVIDSKSLSTGTGLLALYAADLRDEGKLSAKEIYEKCLARVDDVQASFVVDNMEYLYKGGRCSGLTSFIATALKIKPSLLLREGKITVGPKYMGNLSKSIAKYCENIIDAHPNVDKTRVFVTHTAIDEKIVETVKSIVREKINPAEIYETVAGSVITSHCGKGTLGVLFLDEAE